MGSALRHRPERVNRHRFLALAIVCGLAVVACGDDEVIPDPRCEDARNSFDCPSDSKCALIQYVLNPGGTIARVGFECVPLDTPTAEPGQSCGFLIRDVGPELATLWDNCGRGHVCDGVCARVCSFSPDSCAIGTCSTDPFLFQGTFGVCR